MKLDSTGNHNIAHQWTDARVHLVAQYKRGKKYTFRHPELDLHSLGIKRHGLLEASINDAECPLPVSVAYSFVAAIRSISTNRENARILSTPPADLARADVLVLFARIDEYFRLKNIKSAAPIAEKVRNIFRDCQSNIRNGIAVSQVGYITALKSPKRQARKDISDRVDANAETKELKLPVSADTTDNIFEFPGNTEEHYRRRLERILATCESILDEHESIQKVIEAARRMPIPPSLSKSTVQKLIHSGRIDEKVANRRTPEEKLIIALKIIDHWKLYSSAPGKARVYIDGIPALEILSGDGGSRTRFGVLLSSHYLSRFALTACFIILLRYTQWNSDTLQALTVAGIKQTPFGYQLDSFKAKTEQFQTDEVLSDDSTIHIEEKAAVRAIEMLLWHNSAVDKYALRRNESAFVSMKLSYRQKLEFDVFLHGKHFHEFTSTWNLPKFTASDIRPQATRYEYLKSGGDIASQQAKLHHASAATTAHYIGGVEIARNESNIKRYSEMLAKAILYITKRKDIDATTDDQDAKTIRAMLAPPSRFSSNEDSYLIDTWLQNPTENRIPIGPAEVELCVYQRAYYMKNMRNLRLANPERFRKSELPRILVCIALYRLINEGPFRRTVQVLEEKINA
ncbi:hypothetical protein [Massilia brevitalea]|uniref:hypothetical protein n=1 Tax=Massilia brevitalea TaxID=442526 RepID=UPI00273921C3|nr:hypothetical protein [Massilia brevitalea]